MFVPLPVPLVSSSVSLAILTSVLCGMACAGGERLHISCLLSSCCAFPSCQWALLPVVLKVTELYRSCPSSISSARSSLLCFCLHVFTICLSAKRLSKLFAYSFYMLSLTIECALRMHENCVFNYFNGNP